MYYRDGGATSMLHLASLMASNPQPWARPPPELLYCPKCAAKVSDPLTCSVAPPSSAAAAARRSESAIELGMGD